MTRRPHRSLRTLLWLTAATLGLLAPAAHAHLLNMTRVGLRFDADTVEVRVDVDLTLLLGGPDGYRQLLQAPAPAQESAMRRLAAELLADIQIAIERAEGDLRLVAWRLPAVAPEDIGRAEVAPMAHLRYTARLAGPGGRVGVSTRPLARVEFPLAHTIEVPATGLVRTRWIELPGWQSDPTELPSIAVPATPAAAHPAWREVVRQFLLLGFLHILPAGLDHVLFVLGLFFLGAGGRALAKQTTAFTVAHATTLGLASYGLVSVPARIVEPLIALSIAYVAVENIRRPRLHPGRLGAVFAFGLLHGLGFAGSLGEVALPKDEFLLSLLAFNLGVDAGQLTVLAAAFFVLGWFRDRPWYRDRVVIPACSGIAAVGAYWTAARAFA